MNHLHIVADLTSGLLGSLLSLWLFLACTNEVTEFAPLKSMMNCFGHSALVFTCQLLDCS